MTATSPYTMTLRGTLKCPRLTEPISMMGGPPRYGASLELHKAIDAGQILEIEAACAALGRERGIKWRDLKICLNDRGDEDTLFLNAFSLKQPELTGELVAGNRVNFTVSFWLSVTKYGNRVNAELLSVSTDL